MGGGYPKQHTIKNLKGEGIVPLMIKDEGSLSIKGFSPDILCSKMHLKLRTIECYGNTKIIF